MNEQRPPVSPRHLLGGLVLPLACYTLIRTLIGSTTTALAIAEGLSAAWLVAVAVRRRRLEPTAVVAMAAVAIEFAAYALTGGNPLALKLRRGAIRSAGPRSKPGSPSPTGGGP